MQSAINSGFKPKVLEYYKKEIIQTYGFEHLITMKLLENSGLIKIQVKYPTQHCKCIGQTLCLIILFNYCVILLKTSSRSYAVCRRLLKLDVYEMSEVDPDDINYVYGIYAPLSVRLVQHIAKSDSKVLSDVLPLLPGPLVEQVNPDVDQSNTIFICNSYNNNVQFDKLLSFTNSAQYEFSIRLSESCTCLLHRRMYVC